MGGRSAAQLGQNIPGQAAPGLAVGAGGFINRAALVQGKESLNLADHLTAGTIRVEHLVEKPKESAPHGKDPLSAVEALVGLGQQSRRQERAKEPVQTQEALLA